MKYLPNIRFFLFVVVVALVQWFLHHTKGSVYDNLHYNIQKFGVNFDLNKQLYDKDFF